MQLFLISFAKNIMMALWSRRTKNVSNISEYALAIFQKKTNKKQENLHCKAELEHS